MQCKKCNSFIPEGYLYCPVCGEEIIIVTDFDIKLEDNIDISSIANTVELPDISGELHKQDNYFDDIDKGIPNKSSNAKKKQTTTTAKKSLIILFVIIGILFIAGAVIAGISISRYYSFDFQYAKAYEQYNEGNYGDATKTAKHLVALDNNEKGKRLLADCYIAQNNYDAAIAVLYDALNDFPDDESLFDTIISCYEAQGDNHSIHELITNSNDSSLLLRYSDYVASVPIFSLESGTYTEPEPIVLSSVGEGNIYYTVDGTVPTEESLLYIGPIPLEYGNTVVSAIFINNKGIVSDVVTKDYSVELDIPDNPVLLCESGNKKTPDMIGIIIPEGCTAYYTEGDGIPDSSSKVYHDPMLMPVGKSKYSFIVYNENGVSSSVVTSEYNLELQGSVKPSLAEYAVSYQLLSKGEDVSLNTYIIDYGYHTNNNTYYVVDEFLATSKTGRQFAVDINSGELFSFSKNTEGSYDLIPL